MIKINLDNNTSDNIETEYYQNIKQDFIKILHKIKRDKKFINLKKFLFHKNGKIKKTNLRKILIGKPDELEQIISDIGEIQVESTHEFLNLYKNVSQRIFMKKLLKKLNINVCPYCNRMYTITLEHGSVRPQLDHYYPKNLYPYLSVSLYNLIPSCPICNQKKSSLDTFEKPILHPYKEEFGNDVFFELSPTKNCYKYLIGDSNEFEVEIQCLNPELKTKIDNLNKTFAITEIYNEHKEYIVDLLKIMVIYNQSQLDEYNTNFSYLFNESNLNTDKEIYSLIIPNIPKESWGKRPFGKLTNDIYNQFKK